MALTSPGPIARLLGSIPEQPTQKEAERGLRKILGDPGLDLLWMTDDGKYVATGGAEATLENGDATRAVTPITHEGRTVGALVHDSSLLGQETFTEVVAVIGLAIERDRVNEELRRQRDLLSAVGDETPAILCLIYRDGTILPDGMNRSGKALVGRSKEELAGQPFWDAVVSADDRDEVRRTLERIIAGEDAPEHLSRWRTANGFAQVAWTCKTLQNIASFPVFLISAVDVSEREQRAQELRESRSRLVEAADGERRRLERNLHDGAQQRLVLLSLSLRRAEAALAAEPETAAEILREASENLAEALGELRELARGLHPATLSNHGLRTALQGLAARSPVPVELSNEISGRLPAQIEAAVYYLVAEALTNIAKHAGGTRASVTATLTDHKLEVCVGDDGVGGAALSAGTGLRGLADRIEAVSGTLTVASGPGGTTLTASIPI